MSYRGFWVHHQLMNRQELSAFLRTLLVVRVASNLYIQYGSWDDFSKHYDAMIRPEVLRTCEFLKGKLKRCAPDLDRGRRSSWVYRLVPAVAMRFVPIFFPLALPVRWPVAALNCLLRFDEFMNLCEAEFDSSNAITALRLEIALLCDEILGIAYWPWEKPDASAGYWRLTVEPVDKFGFGYLPRDGSS